LTRINNLYYSVVSVWEVQLKHDRRPDAIPFDAQDFSESCHAAGFIPLDLMEEHVLCVRTLSRPADIKPHNDPFDRLLLAQAKAENMGFLTHDALIPGYGEKCVMQV